jgi:polyribonucleotide nucleotidyltransferase
MRAPYAMTITNARASVTQNAATGSTMVQVNVNSVGIFGSNNLTINATSKTSVGHPNTIVIANPSVPDDAEITFNVTAAGTGAKGLKVVLYYT